MQILFKCDFFSCSFIFANVELAYITDAFNVLNFLVFFRNGCRPFIEVYHGEQRVLTTVKEIEKMR